MLSVTEIAVQLGRHRSTIYRELQRNTFYHEEKSNNGYFPVSAQDLYLRRRAKLKKLNQNPALKTYVIDRLKMMWSPEQISGHLRMNGANDFCLSHETIYQFVFSAEGKALNLYRHLCRPIKNRRRRYARKPRSLRGIPLHMGINHRPETVNSRENFGHWEGDLMIFRREHGQANVTSLVERKSRYTVLLKNRDRRSSGVVSRIRETLVHLPGHSRQSITFDRGSEFMAWPLLQRHIKLRSYYCDPRAPWQKGTNENTNGRIRRFLPAETNINEVTADDLKAICRKLNGTPRKCLGYRTPHEVFQEYLQRQENNVSI